MSRTNENGVKPSKNQSELGAEPNKQFQAQKIRCWLSQNWS